MLIAHVMQVLNNRQLIKGIPATLGIAITRLMILDRNFCITLITPKVRIFAKICGLLIHFIDLFDNFFGNGHRNCYVFFVFLDQT